MTRRPFVTHSQVEYAPLAAAVLSLALLTAIANPAAADWTVELEPVLMEVYGHDPHVLTVGDVSLDLAAVGLSADQRAVNVDTNSGGAYRGRIRYDRGLWGWGVDYLWFATSQDRVSLTAAAAGPLEPTFFEIAGRGYVSDGPDEVLFFDVLGDTDVAIWTADRGHPGPSFRVPVPGAEPRGVVRRGSTEPSGSLSGQLG